MGEPVRIQDLARQMISLSGLKIKDESNLNGDIDIKYTGLRPGEKLYEELLIDQENTDITQHKRIMRSLEKSYAFDEIQGVFDKISQLTATSGDIEWALAQLEYYVDGYVRSSDIQVN